MNGPAAQPQTVLYYQPVIPPKVQAAMHFLSFCHGIRSGGHGLAMGSEEWKNAGGRELHQSERRAEDAALSVLSEYFNSEGFGLEIPPLPAGVAPPGQDPPPLMGKSY